MTEEPRDELPAGERPGVPDEGPPGMPEEDAPPRAPRPGEPRRAHRKGAPIPAPRDGAPARAARDDWPYRLPSSDEDLLAECEVDTFRAGGPGGQHQNMTDSGVRLRHRPTGLTVSCRSERSQLQNKRTCLRRLRARIERLLAPPAPPRVATRPSRAAREQRLELKARRSRVKRERRPPTPED